MESCVNETAIKIGCCRRVNIVRGTDVPLIGVRISYAANEFGDTPLAVGAVAQNGGEGTVGIRHIKFPLLPASPCI